MTTGRTRGGFGGSRELGKYKLVNELAKSQLGALWAGMGSDAGEGGEAPVFLVRRFDTSVIENPDQVDNLSEAAWWAMEHSQDEIARTLDVVKTESELGMVYAYNEGEVLRALLRLATFKRKPFPVPVALRIALDVLQALATVREQATEDHIELSCGGLSPDSVLVGTDGRTRLLDVGAAGVLCGAERVLRNPEMTAYAAPEQLEETPQAGARADVFSSGILIWEMLLGKRLFVGSNYAAVSAKVAEAKVPRLDAAKPVGGEPIPEEVADLVARALKPDPAERFADCRELVAAIEALSSEPAEREAVGEMVDALDGNALATRRKVIDRARGVQSPAAKPIAKRAPSPVAAPPKPTSSPNAAPAPPQPPPKPGRRPPPPPRARMESLDSELLEPAGDSEAPGSAGVAVDVELDAPGVPSDVTTAEPADKAATTDEQPAAEEGGDTGTAEAGEGADGFAGDDVPPPPPEMRDVPLPPPGLSEPALIEALTNDSTPKPESTDDEAGGSDEAEAGKDADDTGSGAKGAAAASSPEASAPEASSSPEAAATATTLDATSEDAGPTPQSDVVARTQRARRVVAMVIGGLAVLLLAGLGISALRGSGKPKQTSSAAAPPPAAPSETAAATASETTPAESASAEPEQADAGSEEAGDAAAEAAAEDSGTAETAPSATEAETAAPAPPPRPMVRHHYKPHPRPKHKFTPSGI